MKIKIKNLGPLKLCDIDLNKKLILFSGQNNTGKTYLSYLLYGLYRVADGSHTMRLPDQDNDFFYKEINQLNKKETLKNNSSEITYDLKENFDAFTKKIISYLNNILTIIYPNSSSEIIPLIEIKLEKGDLLKINKKYGIEEKEGYDWNLQDGIFTIIQPQGGKYAIMHRWDLNRIIFSIIYQESLKTFFFPAERSALQLFYKSIIREKASDKDLFSYKISNNVPENNLPLAINDFLYFADKLGEYPSKKNEFGSLSDEIEKITGGKISIDKYNNVVYTPLNSNLKFDLNVSSSTIKSLTSLIFYFRHIAQKGDVIFIDEPELNLHPDNQRKFARILAKAVNKGIKVIVSTHSDYIVKEFNNLLMLSGKIKNKEKLLKKTAYTKDEILNKEEVGVYLFEDSVVKQIPIDEYGIVSTTFDKTIDEINNASELIGMEIGKK